MSPNKKLKPNPTLGIAPEGVLLEFKADFESEFGFAYERFLHFKKDVHSHPKFVFCTARGECEFEVTEVNTGKTFINSKKLTVFKAPDSPHCLHCGQSIYENLVFLISVERMHRSFTRLGYSKEQWHQINDGIKNIERSDWFNSLVERYFLKKVFYNDDFESIARLEEEILQEVLSILLGGSKNRSVPLHKPSVEAGPLKRVIESIELSLFSQLDLDLIAKKVGMSRASLLRIFRSELGVSPMTYVRNRRLEEAMQVLKNGRHSVNETAFLVGYKDPSAFARAFKKKFGFAPGAAELK